jgi:sulfonate transport system permease protein
VYSEQFAYLDRMFFVALLVVIYTSISFALFNRLSLALLQWAPRQGRVDG